MAWMIDGITANDPVSDLKALLKLEEAVPVPGVTDPLTAIIADRMGFKCIYFSGAASSAEERLRFENIRRKPMIRKPNEASNCKRFSGIKAAIDPPAKAPNRLAKTKALAEPRKTAKGRFVVPLMATVASCVLSPSSARNTVMNVDNNRVKSICLIIGLRLAETEWLVVQAITPSPPSAPRPFFAGVLVAGFQPASDPPRRPPNWRR